MSTLYFDIESPYRRLAKALDALPQRFPAADDESDLRLLAYLFTPEQAALAGSLLPEFETVDEICRRLGREPGETRAMLKEMASKGLVNFGKTSAGRAGFSLKPWVVGIFEAQGGRIDAGLSRLYEDYYQKAFGVTLKVRPQIHRVVPIRQTIKNNMEVQPYESATALVDRAQAWAVQDCICRKQIALIGKPCGHPIDVCMTLGNIPGMFDGGDPTFGLRPLTHDEALETLKRAAAAGLVHCVSNNQRDTWYICNCCTCGCGVLRGMAELGIANVVAKSAFVNTVDESLCSACEDCLDVCQFGALTMDGVVHVDAVKCAGCGVCVPACPQGALGLVRRDEVEAPPVDERGWMEERRRLATD